MPRKDPTIKAKRDFSKIFYSYSVDDMTGPLPNVDNTFGAALVGLVAASLYVFLNFPLVRTRWDTAEIEREQAHNRVFSSLYGVTTLQLYASLLRAFKIIISRGVQVPLLQHVPWR